MACAPLIGVTAATSGPVRSRATPCEKLLFQRWWVRVAAGTVAVFRAAHARLERGIGTTPTR
jgi:hypothetical protein